MLFGKCVLPLNEKRQFNLPPNYRGAFGSSIYITQGFDRNLFLLSQQTFNTIYTHINATSISDPLARLLNRLFMGNATEVAIDGSGRIELPSNLCEYAGLDQEIVIVGQGEYLEIWSRALWQKQIENMNDFEANAQRFEKFDISLT
jgi:MraZ protein